MPANNLLNPYTSSWLTEDVVTWMTSHLFNIIVILVGTWAIRKYGSRLAMKVIRRTVRRDLYPTETDRRKRINTLQSLVNAAFQAGTWILAVLLIISELRPNYTGALFASAGVFGLAIGFGAQSLIKDFVTGIFIITENQYRVGDVVTLGAVTGKVEAITIRTTVLRDVDGSVHHVPNGSIIITTNKTLDYSSIHEPIVITEDTKLSALEKAINEVSEQLVADPELAKRIKVPPYFDKVLGVDTNGDMIVLVAGKTTPSSHLKIKGEFYRLFKVAAKKHKVTFHLEKK